MTTHPTPKTFTELFAEARKALDYAVEGVLVEVTEQVCAEMKARNMSRTDLARVLGTSQAYVTKMLAGGNNFTIRLLVKIAEAMDRDIEIRFVERKPANPPPEGHR